MRLLTIAAALAGLASVPAAAQTRTPSVGQSPGPVLDDDALRRLDAAMRHRKTPTDPVPFPTLPQPTVTMRARAFDALRAHIAAPAMDARARAGEDAGRAGIATAREQMLRRLDAALGLNRRAGADSAAAIAPARLDRRVPVLFISASIPTAVLRRYADQLEAARGMMVMRGMPGGLRRVAPMAALAARVLRRDPGCGGPACAMRDVQLLVDPLLFRQHGIDRVPALAMIAGDPSRPYCERDGGSPPSRNIIYGDAALSGLLDEYARLGGAEEVRDARARLDAR